MKSSSSGPLSSTLGKESIHRSRTWGIEGTDRVEYGPRPKPRKRGRKRRSKLEVKPKMHFALNRTERPLCGAHSRNVLASEWGFREHENSCLRCLAMLKTGS